jgi:hypothetical protein
VALTWVFDTVHQMLIYVQCKSGLFLLDLALLTDFFDLVYHYTVTHFGDFVHLFAIPSTSPVRRAYMICASWLINFSQIEMSFIPATALVVHVFYAHKIWKRELSFVPSRTPILMVMS